MHLSSAEGLQAFVCRGYSPGKSNNRLLIIWKVLYSVGHGALNQRVKCRHMDKTLTFSSRETFGQQVPFNLKHKAVLLLLQNSRQLKEKQTHTMPSPPKEQNNPLPQTNQQDTLSEKHAKDDFCAITINEPPPVIKRYAGLENQGATCYLNTVLQILFMTEVFREAVEPYVRNNSERTIINHIAQLFERLKSGERKTATTERITAELNIDVHKQEDAAKCLQKILQKIQKIKCASEISKIFQGVMTQSTVCMNPAQDHDPLEQVKPFFMLSISLDSEPPVHMQKCFDSYFTPIFMCGEDQQVYCKYCKMMMDTEIISSLQEVPSVLVLHLERFEFDYDSMCCVKNYSSVRIPPQLLVKEQTCTYDLYAIANHSGSLDGGHYYADVKDHSGWLRFDDSRVKRLEMYLTRDPDIYSDEAYLLLYKKCEPEGPQIHSAQVCNNSEDAAGPDVSFSAGSISTQDTFSVVNETKGPEKHRKRPNTPPEDEPKPKNRRQQEQNNQENSDSNSETEGNTAQTTPTEPLSVNAEHNQPTLNNSSGEMDSRFSERELNNKPEGEKDQQCLQVLRKKSDSDSETIANANMADESTLEIQPNGGDHNQPTPSYSSGEMDSEREINNEPEEGKDRQNLQVLVKNSHSDCETEENTAQTTPVEPLSDTEVKSPDAEHDQPTPSYSSGEMDSEREINNRPDGEKDQRDQRVLLENSDSETEANASRDMPDESTLPMPPNDDNDNQLKLLPSCADRVSEQKGSSVESFHKDQKQSNNNETKRAVCYIVISFLSVLVFLSLFIVSYYCAPHLLTLAVVVLLLSLIGFLLLLARSDVFLLLSTMFTTDRNRGSQRSRVI